MKTPKMKEDPELKRQQEAAANEKVNTIQDRLRVESDAAVRYFGRSTAAFRAPSIVNVATGTNSSRTPFRDAVMTEWAMQSRGGRGRASMSESIQRSYSK